jgi:DNA-binding FadR family transcriptional regulator
MPLTPPSSDPFALTTPDEAAVAPPAQSLGAQGLVTQSLAKQIAEQIRQAIVEGRLQADQRLPTEEDLAARFSVSRPTIREALKRLAAQNLIRSRRGPTGGTFVCRPSAPEAAQQLTETATMLVSLGAFTLADFAEARGELEHLCARLACARHRPEHLQRMRGEIARQRDLSLPDEGFCAADIAFHRALVDAADSPVIGFLMHAVIEALQPVSNMVIVRFRDRLQTADQHQAVLDAITAGDEAAATQAVGTMMGTLRAQYQAAQDWRAARDDATGAVSGAGVSSDFTGAR